MTTKPDAVLISMLRERYTPNTRYIVSPAEKELIEEVLELKSRNRIELQNIRNLVVLVYSREAELAQEKALTAVEMDAMSAICSVIDLCLAKKTR